MKPPFRPADEARRLVALRDYDLLDTLPEQALDDLAALAAHICEAPISLISLVDENRQWFKSRVGLSIQETSRDVSFCAHALLEPGVLVVNDAAADERFAKNPLVTGEPHIRFYAGAPLFTPDGQALGTLCVIDKVPRQLTPYQLDALRILSRQVMAQFEVRRQALELTESEHLLRTIFDYHPEGVMVISRDGTLRTINRPGLSIIEAKELEEVEGQSIYSFVSSECLRPFKDLIHKTFLGEPGEIEIQVLGINGTPRWVEMHATPLLGENGAVNAVLVITRDISNRRRIEAESQKRLNELQFLLDAVPALVFYKDREGRFIRVNRALSLLTGLPPEDFIGKTDAELGSPECERHRRDDLQVMESGQAIHHLEERIHTPSGPRWLLTDKLPHRDRSGNIIGVIGFAVDISARKQADDDSFLLTQRFTLATEAASIGVWDWDIKSDTWYASPTYFSMLGYKPDDGFLDRTFWLNRLHPDDHAMVGEKIKSILSGSNAPYEYEARMLHADGTYHWISVIGTVLSADEKGKARRLLGVRMDVTARKSAEHRIRQLNRVYAMLTAINQAIIREPNDKDLLAATCKIAVETGRFEMSWIGLTDGRFNHLEIVAHAGATESTLELLRGLLIGKDIDCAFSLHALRTGQHGICNDIAKDPLTAGWRDEALRRNYRSMASLPLKSGERVIGTFNLYANEPDFFDEDEMHLLDQLATDIAFALEFHEREVGRRAVEQALRDTEARFRQLAENIQEVFWITDPAKNQMIYISPAYEKIWGRPCAGLYAEPRNWLQAIHEEDRARIVAAAETKQLRGDYSETYRIVRPDGSIRWIHDRAFPVKGSSGEVLRIVGTAEDITQRRLLEDQLRQSQKMEAIGQLAGGVAHDFNNILAAIMMQAELAVIETNPSAATKEFLDDIKAATERAANLTRQLLAFSRRQVMRTRQLDLNEIVASLTKMLQRILGEDIRLQLNLHPSSLLTRADAGMLDQVILNLVVNARDAMPGGGHLYIETTQKTFTPEEVILIPDASVGRHVCLRVTDTGTGIPAEYMSHIFEPFFTTKESGKGTGLGLATVFGIVKQHGGALAVESTAGKGTTFEIFLPASNEIVNPPEKISSRSKPKGGNETILLVEDETSVRTLTRAVLEWVGYNVLEASDGVEALKIYNANSEKIRLLLTDIVMPEGVSGRELAAQLRIKNAQLRVVFTSGYSADIAGRELSLQEGQNFIQKPASPQHLLETVRNCLDG
ncbi:MAG: sensor hybrid histidine kinase [Verrucomicrobiales bacterium]|nr:sensor hybrid histidine kinase [Verrucomicrobiales bacterium]